MKYQNIFVYAIIAIGLLAIPALLESGSAQTNSTNQTSTQNKTMSNDTQALMSIDLPGLKDNLETAKQSLANGDTEEALTQITDIENQVLLLKPQPSFTSDIQKIKDSVSKKDLNKALDDLTKVQTDVLKADTEMLKAQIANPMLAEQNTAQNEDDGDGGGEDDGDGGGEDNT
ncbi:MAG TPA: hypothetical protein VEW92_05530 [Nitrososphaeraceae archaeon]|jgi:hypothetical protein|nr:hypothetical protein [Nitrososphaeraceae archaeon]